MKRIAVLASGNGSNLQAVLDACAHGDIDGRVVAVLSDRSDAYALERARASSVEFVCAPPRPPEFDRRAWDADLANLVATTNPDWVVLAGFMRLLSSSFLDRFPGRVINLHPALPGELPGTRAIERAFDEFAAGQRRRSGVMVHLVPDEGVDCGPVLATAEVAFQPNDSLETFAARMHEAEHKLLVTTLSRLIDEEHS